MKSSLKPLYAGLIAAALALAATSMDAAVTADRPGDVSGPRIGSKVKSPETEVIRFRFGKVPYVTLSSDIFYRVLASEVAAQRGVFGSAGKDGRHKARRNHRIWSIVSLAWLMTCI